MSKAGRTLRFLTVSGALVAAALGTAGNALAESCVYDAPSRTVTAAITPGSQATLVVSGSSLHFGQTPVACGGATTANTDQITINGGAGSVERLVLDERGGVFGPGYTTEFNTPEIEMTINLGDESDSIVIWGTEGDDQMAAGQSGLALTGDGDVDAVVSPNTFNLEVNLLGGDNFFNGRGTFGAGLHFLGPIIATAGSGDDFVRGSTPNDVITAGAGNDEIEGNGGDDTIDAGPGNDAINAGAGNDDVTGGTGADSVVGGGGDDILRFADGEADTAIEGGGNSDTAYYDLNVDPEPVSVETKIPSGGGGNPPPPPPPPPPPDSQCQFDAAARTVTMTIPSGGSGTVSVSGGAIGFANPAAQDCSGATVSNVDTITVNGNAGTTESLTIDQTGGALAPGASLEGGVSEIEISVQLGDATDNVTILGSAGDDTLAAGTNGVGLNADSDADVTFGVLPAVLELRGGGGVNYLTARGGTGAGTLFPGKAVLRAGDNGDTLRGGLGDDELYGGAGNDTLEGREGNDWADGADGADTLAGAAGNDTLIGGTGADSLAGSDGDDTLRADDDAADTAISGGAGIDTAYYDLGLDPNPGAVENKIPA
jgi:Ca2+-binding RTX toxin-like protein